jgi:apoptotic chromatin condensation inducer in the nucleus
VLTLDELFRKTTTLPAIYWLPLTPEEVEERKQKAAAAAAAAPAAAAAVDPTVAASDAL